MDDVHLEHHVVVHEVSQSGLVCHDASHLRCREEDVFGLLLGEELLHGFLPGQVKFLVRSCDDVGVSLPLQFPHYRRADHPPMACNINFTVLTKHLNHLLFNIEKHEKNQFSFSCFIHSKALMNRKTRNSLIYFSFFRFLLCLYLSGSS